jgi:hypothetical protein
VKHIDWRHGTFAAVLLVAGALIGANMTTTNVAHGQVRGTSEPPAFQSGGQLSVPILKEISATLQQIDSRLARLETVAQKLQATSRTTTMPATTGTTGTVR